MRSWGIVAIIFSMTALSGTAKAQTYGTYAYGRGDASCCVPGLERFGDTVITPQTSFSGGLTFSGATDANDITSASSRASASLATGKLGAAAFSSGYGRAVAQAGFRDTITFEVVGASEGTITPVGIRLDYHGNFGFSDEASYAFSGYYLDIQQLVSGDKTHLAQLHIDRQQSGSTIVQRGWQSISHTSFPDEQGWIGFDVVYRLVGPRTTVQLDGILQASAAFGGAADFSNSASLKFVLPQNVTFTSASGAFLMASAVPEPGAWAMLILGFGIAGMAVRRSGHISLAQFTCSRPTEPGLGQGSATMPRAPEVRATETGEECPQSSGFFSKLKQMFGE